MYLNMSPINYNNQFIKFTGNEEKATQEFRKFINENNLQVRLSNRQPYGIVAMIKGADVVDDMSAFGQTCGSGKTSDLAVLSLINDIQDKVLTVYKNSPIRKIFGFKPKTKEIKVPHFLD